MLDVSAIALTYDAVEAAKLYLRIETDDDDAFIAGLLCSAICRCEREIGCLLWQRACTETLPTATSWQRLSGALVASITGVSALAADGAETGLAAQAYEVDIDVNGAGRIRFAVIGGSGRVKIRFTAGRAATWDGISPDLRQGIICLVAHWYGQRERDDVSGLPENVASLWRSARVLRLA